MSAVDTMANKIEAMQALARAAGMDTSFVLACDGCDGEWTARMSDTVAPSSMLYSVFMARGETPSEAVTELMSLVIEKMLVEPTLAHQEPEGEHA
jgi:hypothetical protein